MRQISSGDASMLDMCLSNPKECLGNAKEYQKILGIVIHPEIKELIGVMRKLFLKKSVSSCKPKLVAEAKKLIAEYKKSQAGSKGSGPMSSAGSSNDLRSNEVPISSSWPGPSGLS